MQSSQPTCTRQEFSEALQSPEIIQYLFQKVPVQASIWLFIHIDQAFDSFKSFLSKLGSNQSYAENFSNVLQNLSNATIALKLGTQDYTTNSNAFSAYKSIVDMLFLGSIIDVCGTSEFSLGMIERWTEIKDKLVFMIDFMLANTLYRQSIIYIFQHCTQEMSLPLCMQDEVPLFRGLFNSYESFNNIRRLFTPTIFAQMSQQFRNTYFECFILNGDCTSLRIFSIEENEWLNQQRKLVIDESISQFTDKLYPVFNPVVPCLSIISKYL
jgi:hypothetical protein